MKFFFLSRPFINSNPSDRLFLRMATPYIIPPKIVLCDALKVLMIRSRNCVKDMFFVCALALALLYRFILKMLIILNLLFEILYLYLPLNFSDVFLQTERREKYEKENSLTLADEVDRVKMEVEQEKAELQVRIH